MSNRGKRFDTIASQAAKWLARRDVGMDVQEKAAFDRWCAADPRHVAATAEVEAMWSALDRTADLGQAETVRAKLRLLASRDRRRRYVMGGGVLVACLTIFLWLQHPALSQRSAVGAAAVTARVEEPERQTLPDGSVVELKDGAKIAVAFQAGLRVVKLENGEAHFSVKKDPLRPFIVEAGAVKIRAVGTAFAVELGRTEVGVLVTEGKVDVSSPTSANLGDLSSLHDNPSHLPTVQVGQRAVVPIGAAVTPTVVSIPATEMAEHLAWRLPRLYFSNASIGDAVALFNRNAQVQLHVADNTVAALRITGVFRSDNIEGFVLALESSLGIRVERRAGQIVLRSSD